ncbi:MAG: DHH family phosphoesterase [FCB group bacterium]|nr:DHH family phosphoesterase [FCB group bacterium]
MSESNALLQQWHELKQRISYASSFVLTTHQNPDADGIGSELALYYLLKKLGKEVHIFNISPTPESLRFMDPENLCHRYIPSEHQSLLSRTDMLIVLDAGSFSRVGQIGADALAARIPVVAIDHHPRENNPIYLQEIVNPHDCSVGKLIFEFVRLHYPKQLDKPIAEALYTAVAGDTGNFRFGNTTRDSHHVAGELMGYGINAYDIYCKLFGNISHSGVRLFSAVLQNIYFSEDRRVVWFVITRQMLKENGADDADTEGITDFLRMIEGVEVSIMFKERNDGSTRINFRSKGRVSTNAIARRFGGGGHEHASGIVSDRPLKELYSEVVETMVQHVKEVCRENTAR